VVDAVLFVCHSVITDGKTSETWCYDGPTNRTNWSAFGGAEHSVNGVCIPGDESATHAAHDLRDDLYFRTAIDVCMSSDESHLIGLVTAINSVHKNSKYPVKFHILVTSAAYNILVLVTLTFFEYSCQMFAILFVKKRYATSSSSS